MVFGFFKEKTLAELEKEEATLMVKADISERRQKLKERITVSQQKIRAGSPIGKAGKIVARGLKNASLNLGDLSRNVRRNLAKQERTSPQSKAFDAYFGEIKKKKKMVL